MGMKFKLDRFDSSLTEAELLTVIDQYNQNPEFHGILVQSPLPDHISEKAVIERISLIRMLTVSTLSTSGKCRLAKIHFFHARRTELSSY